MITILVQWFFFFNFLMLCHCLTSQLEGLSTKWQCIFRTYLNILYTSFINATKLKSEMKCDKKFFKKTILRNWGFFFKRGNFCKIFPFYFLFFCIFAKFCTKKVMDNGNVFLLMLPNKRIVFLRLCSWHVKITLEEIDLNQI